MSFYFLISRRPNGDWMFLIGLREVFDVALNIAQPALTTNWSLVDIVDYQSVTVDNQLQTVENLR